jgi:hypothetical protein
MANFAIKIIFLLKPNTLYKITGLAMHCCLRRLQGWTWATGKEVILWPMAAAMTFFVAISKCYQLRSGQPGSYIE